VGGGVFTFGGAQVRNQCSDFRQKIRILSKGYRSNLNFNFKNVKEVAEKLEDFNKFYQWYLGYRSPEKKLIKKKDFVPKIYFIRKIYQNPETEKGYIKILNERVCLLKSYINLFTLSAGNLKEEQL